MAKIEELPIHELAIDLKNFRTVTQENELDATKAMISISPENFWGLMESILDDGYLPTENIIVLEKDSGLKQIREGNRRIASLKIIHRIIDPLDVQLPSQLLQRIESLTPEWLQENIVVPCNIFPESETDVVDRIVTRTHGKGSKAGRDGWPSVATARHNREINQGNESSLDLLEKYLAHGTNLTPDQKLRWSGKYNLTVLDEAIKRTSTRFGVSNSRELVQQYPKIQYRAALEGIIHGIGLEALTFPMIRDSADFAAKFGLPSLDANPSQSNSSTTSSTTTANATQNSQTSSGVQSGASQNSTSNTSNASGASTSGSASSGKTHATSTHDERSVKKALRGMKIMGQNRTKVVDLRKELLNLKLEDNPLAFCFLLRSVFEISAKAYCLDHKGRQGAPKFMSSGGKDRTLSDVLEDIVEDLTQGRKDQQMLRLLHGPLTELKNKNGLLSITSMNQLIHNPHFVIHPGQLPALFSNIFPLLVEMNK